MKYLDEENEEIGLNNQQDYEYALKVFICWLILTQNESWFLKKKILLSFNKN